MSGDREPWIAVRVGLPESGKVIELPSDAARWGLIVLWCKAKRQTPSGVFRSERVVKALVGKYAKYLGVYVDLGFLHVAPVACPDARCRSAYEGLDDGAIAVHSWHDHQRDHALRQLAYRTGDTLSDTVSDSTSDFYSRASVGVSSLVSNQEGGGPGEPAPPDPVSAYYQLTTRYPRDNVLSWLNDMGTRHGEARTSAMLARCYSESRDLGTLLGRTQAALRAEEHTASVKERNDEAERLKAKRRPDPLLAQIKAAMEDRYVKTTGLTHSDEPETIEAA